MPSARRRRIMYSSLNGASLSATPSTRRLLIRSSLATAGPFVWRAPARTGSLLPRSGSPSGQHPRFEDVPGDELVPRRIVRLKRAGRKPRFGCATLWSPGKTQRNLEFYRLRVQRLAEVSAARGNLGGALAFAGQSSPT